MNAFAAPWPDTCGVQLRLLGRFELRHGGRLIRVSSAGERLLAYLAVRGEPVSRPAAAAELWPDRTDLRAGGNLRSALSRLPGGRDNLVCSTQAGMSIPPHVQVDIWHVSGLVDSRIRRPAAELGQLDLALLRQDVLPHWPDGWLLGTREWFRQIRLHALEALCDWHRDSGRLDAALEAGLAAVASDPLRESAQRRLARVHLAEGNTSEALRQYHAYRGLLRAELGLAPSPQFRGLVAPLLRRPLDAVRRVPATPEVPAGTQAHSCIESVFEI